MRFAGIAPRRSVAVSGLCLAVAVAVACGNSRSPGAASASTSSAPPVGAPSSSEGEEAPSTVVATLDGASASLMESDVARPIEQALVACPGVATVRSRSRSGRSVIAVSSRIGADLDEVLVCLRERIDGVTGALPAGVMAEIRRPRRPAIALVTLADAARPADAVGRDAALLRELIAPIPGVTEVRVCAPKDAIAVELDPVKLRSLGLTTRAVVRALEGRDLGSVGDGQATRPDDVGAIEVASSTGARAKLSDVAVVRVDTAPGGCRATGKRGEPAAALEVHGQPRAGARVASAVEASELATKVDVRLAGVDARLTMDRVRAAKPETAGAGAPPRDPEGNAGLVALDAGRDEPAALWLAPPADAADGWWIAVGARVAPPDAWTWRSVMEPAGGTPARPTWIALSGGDGACVEAARSVTAALGDVALPGTVEQIGEGASTNGEPEVQLTVDRKMAAELGVSVGDVAAALRLMQPQRVGSTEPGVWVRIAGDADKDVATWLGRVDVDSSRGSVALASVVRVSDGEAPGERARVGGKSAVVVTFVARPGAAVSPDEAWVREKVRGKCGVVGMGLGEF